MISFLKRQTRRCFQFIQSAGGAKIEFENVTFGYEPGRPVLDDISLVARPGQMIALVGPTGAGKSTLVSLIPRFFDPWQGRVTIDGIDIRTLTLSSLRQSISIVLQEPFLLPITIAENIAYGSPDASRQDIVKAAIAARADEFISRLPQGYDTVIGESGATLSAGEQQRLAIARALLKDAPILILDEPTSALDARTEALLMDAIERLTKQPHDVHDRASNVNDPPCGSDCRPGPWPYRGVGDSRGAHGQRRHV